jgi:hypothetical protein
MYDWQVGGIFAFLTLILASVIGLFRKIGRLGR